MSQHFCMKSEILGNDTPRNLCFYMTMLCNYTQLLQHCLWTALNASAKFREDRKRSADWSLRSERSECSKVNAVPMTFASQLFLGFKD